MSSIISSLKNVFYSNNNDLIEEEDNNDEIIDELQINKNDNDKELCEESGDELEEESGEESSEESGEESDEESEEESGEESGEECSEESGEESNDEMDNESKIKEWFIEESNLDLDDYNLYTIDILKKYFNPKNLIDQNNIFKTYKLDITKCIQKFKNLSINRKLDHEHWNKIKKNYLNEIKLSNDSELIIYCPFFIGLFENNFFIYDGQHRIKAMKKILNENVYDFTCMVHINLFFPNSYNNMLDTIKKINSSKPLDINTYINNNISEIIAHIRDKFKLSKKKSILTNKKPRRPYINEFKLRDNLGKKQYIISYDNTKILDIFSLIDKINNNYSSNDYQKKIKKLTPHMQRISAQSNCYLGFDTDFEWIDFIEEKLRIKFIKNNEKENKKELKKIEQEKFEIKNNNKFKTI